MYFKTVILGCLTGFLSAFFGYQNEIKDHQAALRDTPACILCLFLYKPVERLTTILPEARFLGSL